MPLSSEAQALFDHAKNSLPKWLTGAPTAVFEWLYGFTEIFDEVRAQGQDWIDVTYLENATAEELNQHAADRGTSRRSGESDASLRARLREVSDSLTEPVLKTGVDAILDSIGLLALFDVSDYVTTGWTTKLIAKNNTYQTLLSLTMVSDATNPPTLVEVGSATTIHYSAGVTTRTAVENLITASSTLFNVQTATASGATTLAAGDVFTSKRFYLSGLVSLRRDRGHAHTNGTCRSFLNRGYRMCNINRPMGYIFILPFGTTVAAASAVAEYLRKNGPAGFVYYVERRINP